MIVSLRHLIGWIASAFRCHEDLVLENFALRQQLLVLHAIRPRRRLSAMHKLFWVMLRKLWAETMLQVADNVQSAVIPNSGHWLAEEQPAALLAEMMPFLSK
jgi:pimeloyl-ACP methyl ester carboxylesterase